MDCGNRTQYQLKILDDLENLPLFALYARLYLTNDFDIKKR